MEKQFSLVGITAMIQTDRFIVYVFTLFISAFCLFSIVDSYFFYSALSACNQMPSRSVLDSAHVQEDMRILCGYESSFIYELCADKLGRSDNSIPALLMKR